MKQPGKILSRQHEITENYLRKLDEHIADIIEGRITEMHEIREIAELMNLHPTHLSNTIRLATGNSACFYFEQKILDASKKMLEENKFSISDIAARLTYDPSNFTKFFKHYMGITPKTYREQFLTSQRAKDSVSLTKNSVSLTRDA